MHSPQGVTGVSGLPAEGRLRRAAHPALSVAPVPPSLTLSGGRRCVIFCGMTSSWSDSLYAAGLVSCDIVGHSAVQDHAVQRRRVQEINDIVAGTLARGSTGTRIWASGGDGGHVLFLDPHWQADALDLVRALRQWAHEQDVPLRIVGHAGAVSVLPGADGRDQPVGEGINQAGAILELGTARGIVVSAEFRRELETAAAGDVRFHDPRPHLLRNAGEREFFLMSLPGLPSLWASPADDDREHIHHAAGWEALYHAKRLLQINSADADVDLALRQLRATDFWLQVPREANTQLPNPFFGQLGGRALREVIRLGQLVERRYDEVLCRVGEDGNTMFLILRGLVGVYNTGGSPGEELGRPEFVLGPGEIVGELAFGLNRKRTADLVTLADTSLLAFTVEELSERLAATPADAEIRVGIDRFITSRVLEHVSHDVPYLIGRDRSGPLAATTVPAESLLEDLLVDTRMVTWGPVDGPVTLDSLGAQGTGPGLYVLVAGSLESRTITDKSLVGTDFPVLYVDLPRALLTPDHEYVARQRPVKILHIGAPALDQLPPAVLAGVMDELKRDVARRYHYDVFISYNFGDGDAVERWRTALTAAGLRIYVDTPVPGERFTTRIEHSLLDSLTMVAFISPHTMVKALEHNWVRKEIRFRETAFDNPWILPVRLPGGQLDDFGLRYTMIDARDDEAAAIRTAI